MTKILLALLTLAMMTGAASAQQRTIHDASWPLRNRQPRLDDFYDSRGRVTGRESISGNTTTIYDASGRSDGKVTTTKPMNAAR
jgi:YD repeat-containing protein